MPTRQEMLSTIDMKIARTSQSDEGTGCFLPVMAKDIIWKFPKVAGELDEMWSTLEEPLYNQSDETIEYVFNLLP